MSSSSQGNTPTSSSRSGSHTPQQNPPYSQTTASFFSYPVSHVVSGIYRRLTDTSIATMPSATPYLTSPEVYTPHRTASPFQPPPLTPLNLTIPKGDLLQQQLLTTALAEEIRLLVPPRLQLVENWRLAYSLDRDGASLSTLYDNCDEYSHRSPRAGYVLVVRDSSPSGAVFGAYMTDAPHPNTQFFVLPLAGERAPPPVNLGLAFQSDGPQTEEALERAGLPPPPSADTTHAGRWSTLRNDTPKSKSGSPSHNLNTNIKNHLAAASGGVLSPPSPSSINSPGTSSTGTRTPERIRFKAFPYSGVNDYMIFCETSFLSLGGGDGHYGLWVDTSLEKGVSASCQTFGNEPLSDEGIKFDIIGVEVWYVGA
ncbi:hypothetical protein N7495_003213 [Penicillium taxi]|uniref:uncharacterized protein n=1 Tax=Penicillium taxi TaxID=168475 RepID=UPI002545801A|nr:uncharacterized protein N7495_003213 [Penicillium taxi]KAJ5902685.1 hypothetical protein N7495_003213 [Penicillium taxi]